MSCPSSPFRFDCTRCGQCCTRPGVVQVTPAELQAIAEFLRLPATELIEALFYRDDDGVWTLDVVEGRGCPFLEGEGCAIHEVKPRQCRTYPFWPEIVESAASWQEEAEHCPGIGQGRVYSGDEIAALVADDGDTSTS